MKSCILVVLFLLVSATGVFSQVGINAAGTPPNSSAMLDINSTDHGLLIPRITAAARNQIPSPATGLLIYNTTSNQFNYYNGSHWYLVGSTFVTSAVGTLTPGGGVSVNVSPSAIPGNTAMLDVNNATRGILFPATTPGSIPAPANGLVIYNTASNLFNFYNGTQWISVNATSTGIASPGGSQSTVGLAIKQGNSTPHHSAILDVSASDKGVLIPRLSNEQRAAILPATGLLIYNATLNAIEYYNGSGWYRIGSATFTCGSSLTINHVAGSVAPVSKTVTYGTATNIPGENTKCWITRNLGASRQALAVDDDSEESAGWYWQFNRRQGYKHDGTTRTPNTAWISPIDEISDWGIGSDPCNIEIGNGWRLPTLTEWTNVDAGGGWTNWTGPWSSALKMHAAGYLNGSNGSRTETGLTGIYSGSNESGNLYSIPLYFTNSSCGANSMISNKSVGSPLRCIQTCNPPAPPTTGTHTSLPTQVVWNWNPAAGATGYRWNTTNNYTTATDMGTATTKTETGLVCGTVYTRYVWSYSGCGNSNVSILAHSSSTCEGFCGGSLVVNHVAGLVAPVTKTVSYGTVTNIPGENSKCWITRNLGASQQATAVSDATEASAGWYWQFNRKQGFQHDGLNVTPAWTITSINESSDWLTANDPCSIELGGNWRMPTYTELYNLDNIGSWIDWTGPWNSGLKLHAAGILDSGGGIMGRGGNGYYWTSTQSTSRNGRSFFFGNNSCQMSTGVKAYGLSMRCLKEN